MSLWEGALRDLLRRVGVLERRAVRFRRGIITSTSPLRVALGGADTEFTARTIGADVTVGDAVAVLTWGHDLLVLGRIGGGPAIACRVVAGSQAVPEGTLTPITWSAATVDTDSMWPGSGTGVVIQKPGLYMAVGAVEWAPNATGWRWADIRHVRGATVTAGPRVLTEGGDEGRAVGVPAFMVACQTGDVWRLYVDRWTGGAPLNVNTASLIVHRIGPAA